MRVAAQTLGCKVNQADTESILGLFRDAGHQVVEFEEEADLYLINTCTVTQIGEKKSRQQIRRAIGRSPGAVVAVLGCYAQTSAEEIAQIPGVSLVMGSSGRSEILKWVERARISPTPLIVVDHPGEFEEIPASVAGERVRVNLKIQDGCEEFCTYCKIPYARGPVRSRRPEKVIQAVEALVGQGCREVVLTGIHLGAYGRDLPGWNLAQILRQVVGVSGLDRVRLGSVDPHELTDELLEICQHPRVCRHLHIPLQAGSAGVLHRMGRRYTPDEYAQVVWRAREALGEDFGLTTDVITGFPGETQSEFDEGLEFCRQMGFSRMHVFRYSPRKGTPAADLPGRVPGDLVAHRAGLLGALADEMARTYAKRWVGRVVQVLVEEVDSMVVGHTSTYLRVQAPGQARVGEMVSVTVDEASADGLIGEVIPG